MLHCLEQRRRGDRDCPEPRIPGRAQGRASRERAGDAAGRRSVPARRSRRRAREGADPRGLDCHGHPVRGGQARRAVGAVVAEAAGHVPGQLLFDRRVRRLAVRTEAGNRVPSATRAEAKGRRPARTGASLRSKADDRGSSPTTALVLVSSMGRWHGMHFSCWIQCLESGLEHLGREPGDGTASAGKPPIHGHDRRAGIVRVGDDPADAARPGCCLRRGGRSRPASFPARLRADRRYALRSGSRC